MMVLAKKILVARCDPVMKCAALSRGGRN